MPRKGFRSITVREEIYEELMQQYTENREDVTRFLYDALERVTKQTQ